MKNAEALKIFIAAHKETTLYEADGYVPLLVGAERNSTPGTRQYQKDNEGVHISGKNDSYCELTGLYYIWKNVDAEYVGLVHYRRYFLNFRHRTGFRQYLFVRNPRDEKAIHILSKDEALDALKNTDIIIKKSKKYHISLEKQLAHFTGEACCRELREVFDKRYPQERVALCEYLKGRWFVECNMFITSKALINQYCQWLFPILEDIDRLHLANCGANYHNRELGYVAEYIFGFWLFTNHIRYQACDVIAPGDSQDIESLGDIFSTGSNVYSKKHRIPVVVRECVSILRHVVSRA